MEHYKIDILHIYRYVYLVLYISYLPIYYIYIYICKVVGDRRTSIWLGLQRN